MATKTLAGQEDFVKNYKTDEGELFQIQLEGFQTISFAQKKTTDSIGVRTLSADPIQMSRDEWKMFLNRGHGLYSTSIVTRTIATLGQYIAEVERAYHLQPVKDKATGEYALPGLDLSILKETDPNAYQKYQIIRFAQDELRKLYDLEREVDPTRIELQRDFKHGIQKILDDVRSALYQQHQLTIDKMDVSSDHILAAAHEAVSHFEWPNDKEKRYAITAKDQLIPPGRDSVLFYDPSKEPSTAAGGSVFKTTKGMGEAGRDNFAHCVTLMEGFNPENRDRFLAEVKAIKPSRGLRIQKVDDKPVDFLRSPRQEVLENADRIANEALKITSGIDFIEQETKKFFHGIPTEEKYCLARAVYQYAIQSSEAVFKKIDHEKLKEKIAPYYDMEMISRDRKTISAFNILSQKLNDKILEKTPELNPFLYAAAMQRVFQDDPNLATEYQDVKNRLNRVSIDVERQSGTTFLKTGVLGFAYNLADPMIGVLEKIGLYDPIRGTIALAAIAGMGGFTFAVHGGSIATTAAHNAFINALSKTYVVPEVYRNAMVLTPQIGTGHTALAAMVDGITIGKSLYLLSSTADIAATGKLTGFSGDVIAGIMNNPIETGLLVAAMALVGKGMVVGLSQQATVGGGGWQLLFGFFEALKVADVAYHSVLEVQKVLGYGLKQQGELAEEQSKDMKVLFAGMLAQSVLNKLSDEDKVQYGLEKLIVKFQDALAGVDISDPNAMNTVSENFLAQCNEADKNKFEKIISSVLPSNTEVEKSSVVQAEQESNAQKAIKVVKAAVTPSASAEREGAAKLANLIARPVANMIGTVLTAMSRIATGLLPASLGLMRGEAYANHMGQEAARVYSRTTGKVVKVPEGAMNDENTNTLSDKIGLKTAAIADGIFHYASATKKESLGQNPVGSYRFSREVDISKQIEKPRNESQVNLDQAEKKETANYVSIIQKVITCYREEKEKQPFAIFDSYLIKHLEIAKKTFPDKLLDQNEAALHILSAMFPAEARKIEEGFLIQKTSPTEREAIKLEILQNIFHSELKAAQSESRTAHFAFSKTGEANFLLGKNQFPLSNPSEKSIKESIKPEEPNSTMSFIA